MSAEMIEYRIIDLEAQTIEPGEILVRATSPETAVKDALGIDVVRSGSKRDLRVRVYFQRPGEPLSMVRLYTKAAAR